MKNKIYVIVRRGSDDNVWNRTTRKWEKYDKANHEHYCIPEGCWKELSPRGKEMSRKGVKR